MYMRMAHVASLESHAEKRQVGAIAVKGGNIIGIGINGTPSGWHTNDDTDSSGKTTEVVLHAEENLISKLAKGTQSAEGSTLYSTTEPCIKCARLIAQSGFDRVVFADPYKNNHGTVMLELLGIEVDTTHGVP